MALVSAIALSRAASPEIFHLVRRHQHRLAEWFDTRLGYRLVLSATTARLVRLASPTGVVSPAPFEPVPRRALVLALLYQYFVLRRDASDTVVARRKAKR